MEGFFKRKESSSGPNMVDLDKLPWDPADRIRILDYHPDQRDEIRRKYWLNGPCQPRGHNFPTKLIGKKKRRFVKTWFDDYGKWLEYSSGNYVGNQGGRDVFSQQGCHAWNKAIDTFETHVGDVNSAHNKALKKCEDLINQNQSIATNFHKQDDITKKANRIRLNATINDCRLLLKNALSFCGHDESKKSLCKGNFLEIMDLIMLHDKELRELPKAAGNNQYLSPSIQKDIANCFEEEVVSSILKEIGDDVFSLLVDESSDVSKKEQMAIVLRYVDAHGLVKERFVGLVHVMETSSLALKYAIDTFFAKYGLSLKRLRGQGYDGANNMRGEFNGLKAKILEENSSAYYVHCFAHQLQLVVVTVARKHLGVVNFFDNLSILMNIVCSSCKRTDILRYNEKERVEKEIGSGILETGSGLNQELSFIRPGDTRWNSHYKTLIRLVDMFPSIIRVLEYVKKECNNPSTQNQAFKMIGFLSSFEFAFYLHLMLHILGLTDILSRALQRKDQDILEAVLLVETTKGKLQEFRERGFDPLLEKIHLFCEKHNIEIMDMTENYISGGGPRAKRQRYDMTNQHYYKFDCFNTVVDMEIQEFGDRFTEINTKLLQNMTAFNPFDSFSKFDASILMRLCEFYPYDFDNGEKVVLAHQLDLYIDSVRKDEHFSNLSGIADLARVMVETRKHISFPLVYRLLKLTLVLPVATATVERCFSAVKIVKTNLRNRIGEDFLNACVVCAVEKEALESVTNEVVIDRFQKMKSRRGQL
ncbi:zinc finger MYM-type protein 1-like [Helianthus annuus]|uniref:zinc finger MYM-type protein 1-like n=1 Tax=Helianthus annuus TaxID=4232 RepID=UPI000B901F5A|nr:zinc finger MYM-type protein 1-like [Helianthus annuus]